MNGLTDAKAQYAANRSDEYNPGLDTVYRSYGLANRAAERKNQAYGAVKYAAVWVGNPVDGYWTVR
jgi:hypothetical protein